MVEATGTEDKVDSLIELLRPYGILEQVRTGRVAMTRGGGDAAPQRPRVRALDESAELDAVSSCSV